MNWALSSYQLLSIPVSFALRLVFQFSDRGRVRLSERVGLWAWPDGRPDQPILWFHGASGGEIRGLIPIMERIKSRFPDYKILYTATNVAGLEIKCQAIDYRFLLPFDSPIAVKGAISQLDLRLLVIAETEIWPSLIKVISDRDVPIVVVNGRISDLTFSKYKKISFLTKAVLPLVDRILTGNRESVGRYLELGAPEDRLSFLGNSKYDGIATVSREDRDRFKARLWSNDYPTLVLGCIWPGEADYWIPVVAEALRGGKRFNVIVFPRHKEKYEFFEEHLKKHNLEFFKWSEVRELSERTASAEPGVVLMDSPGELLLSYGVGDLAFVGASLIDVGGHNPFVAVGQGALVAMGPHHHTVKQEVRDLQDVVGIEIVKSQDETRALIDKLVSGDSEIKSRAGKAQAVWRSHLGTSDKLASLIAEGYLKSTGSRAKVSASLTF